MTELWRDLADTLRDETSLWRGKPVAVVEAEWARVAAGHSPLNLDIIQWVPVDGEAMAEEGVEEVISAIAPLVEKYGLDLHAELVESGEPEEHDYVVAINGHPVTVLYADDWTFESPWRLATIRPLAYVNELLARAGIPQRLHTLYAGGNEGIALLIDPAVSDAIRASRLFADDEIPELAVQP